MAIAALALGCEAALVARELEANPDFSRLRIFGSLTTGLAFVACGLIARWRSGYPRMGMVLVIAGFLWMSEDLINVNTYAGETAAEFTDNASGVAFALIVMSFPSGSLRGVGDRLVVAASVLYAFVLTPLTLMGTPPCPEAACARWMPFAPGSALLQPLDRIHTVVGIAAMAGGLIIIRHRWVHATKPARRQLTPFLVVALVLGLAGAPSVVSYGVDPLGDALPLAYALFPLAFLLGLLRVRLVRVGVTDLVRELDRASSLTRLRDVLARTLGDPSVAVRRWDGSRWNDEGGQPVAEPEATPAQAVTSIDHHGQRLGALVHDPELREDPKLLDSVVGAIRLRLQNDQLHAEVTRQLARASDATDSERRRVGRDLHDGAQQRLVGLLLDTGALRRRLTDDPSDEVQELLQAIEDGASAALGDLRRLVHDLAPPTLAENGLGPAVQELALTVAVPVEVVDDLPARPGAALESAAFLMISEALANVSKHAEATAARVLLRVDDAMLTVAVSDDGCGGADLGTGSGLLGLCERAAAFGGRITLTSPPGHGTTVTARFPLPPDAPGLGLPLHASDATDPLGD